VQELARLLHGRHAGLAPAAKLSLERLADDDSRMVPAAAEAALATADSDGDPGTVRAPLPPRRVAHCTTRNTTTSVKAAPSIWYA
jgi:hypothetical protein